MPSLVTKTVPALVGAALVLAVAAPAGATTPDDGDQVALDRFAVIAESRGYDLVDPVCEPRGDEGSEFLCFARVGPDPDDLFVIRNNVASDVVDYTVVAEPSVDAGPTNGPPRGAELATFDAFSYFVAMFSADPKAFLPLEPVTAPGSAAEAYLGFQREAAETAAELDIDLPSAPVYLTSDGPRMCPGPELPCSDFTDIVVSGGLVESFSVDGNPIAPRLGVPSEPTVVGSSTFTTVASYRTVSSDSLIVYLEIESTSPVVLDLMTATYIHPDAAQTPVDPEQSIGAVALTTGAETITVMLAFPGADPGGTLRFSVFPDDGTTALAAHVPVPAFLAPDAPDEEPATETTVPDSTVPESTVAGTAPADG